MIELSKRQEQCLSIVQASIATRGYPPTLREIGVQMGIRSTNAINDHLRALEKKGFVERSFQRSRGIKLTGGNQRGPVPKSGWEWNPTPGHFVPRSRCLVCQAVTFAKACAVCGKELLEVMPS